MRKGTLKVTVREYTNASEETTEWQPISEQDGKTVYGYTPKISRPALKEYDIFEQRIDAIDLPALVRLLNPEQPS